MSISRPMERICFLFDAMLGAVETTLVIVALVELASDTPQEIESRDHCHLSAGGDFRQFNGRGALFWW